MTLGNVMLDIEGTELTPSDRRLLRSPAVGGLILFARNYVSPEQIADLVAEVRGLRKPSLLIAVDHEGGRVQRFREGFTAIPPMRSLGLHYRRDPDEARALAETVGWIIGRELRSVGVDLSFSPCVDLDWGVNAAIGDRSFHRRPAVVTDLATRYSRGLARAGMAAVAKHFPGHGAVVADSHESLPIDRREPGELLDDIEPFHALIRRRAVAGIMLSHVLYAEIDNLPASLSAAWISQELRGRLNFDGAVFSDDMSMKATGRFGSMAERCRRALDAGTDMVVVCNDREAARSAVGSLEGYSNPPSLVRLARLHGGQTETYTRLRDDGDWQSAVERLTLWTERPVLELDA